MRCYEVLHADLITRQDPSLVSRASPDGGQHHQPATGGLLSNQETHSLHLSITAHSKVSVLPACKWRTSCECTWLHTFNTDGSVV